MSFYGMSFKEVMGMPFCSFTALSNVKMEIRKMESESMVASTAKKMVGGKRGK